jgi:hypothetical protein
MANERGFRHQLAEEKMISLKPNRFRIQRLVGLALYVFGASLIVNGASSSKVNAADIFVRDANGSELSNNQRTNVTDMVKRAVRQMPEHTLVQSENRADFVLQPSVIKKADDTYLRIEKRKDGDLISQSEERIDAMNPSNDKAIAATESAMQMDQVAENSSNPDLGPNNGPNIGTSSGDTASISEDSSSTLSDEDNSHLQSGVRDMSVQRNSNQSGSISGASSSSTNDSPTASGVAGGDVRAPSPVFQKPDRTGAFQIGVGPAFSLGMQSDQILYDVNIGYAMPLNEMFSGKAFGDLNLASGADANRFLNFGVGGDFFPMQSANMLGARPYLTADLGYAFTRDKDERTADAPAVGAGAGFKFAAQQLNLDVNLHYTMLTTKIQNDYPSILGIRAALNF